MNNQKRQFVFSCLLLAIGPMIGLLAVLNFSKIFNIFVTKSNFTSSDPDWSEISIFAYIIGIPVLLIVLLSMRFLLKYRVKNSYLSVFLISLFVPTIASMALLLIMEGSFRDFGWLFWIVIRAICIPVIFASVICWYLSGLFVNERSS